MRPAVPGIENARRWKLIYPDELVRDSGIACAPHGRPTGLLHSCGEAFCDECLEVASECPGCGEDIPAGEKRFACGCA